ncbi:Dachshund -like protein 1, partial [Takifugu flavidus]
LELPFMMMPHPLIPVSLPPASVTMAMSQMNHLSTIANMAAAAQGQSLPSRMVTSVIKERVPDSPSPAPSLEDHRRPGSHPSSHRSSSVSSSPAHTESSSDRIPIHHNGLSMNHALLGLSPNIPPGPKEGDLAHDMSHEAATHKRIHADKGETGLFALTAGAVRNYGVNVAAEQQSSYG